VDQRLALGQAVPGQQREPGGGAAAARGPVNLAVTEHGDVALVQLAVEDRQLVVENDAVDAAGPVVSVVPRGPGRVEAAPDGPAGLDSEPEGGRGQRGVEGAAESDIDAGVAERGLDGPGAVGDPSPDVAEGDLGAGASPRTWTTTRPDGTSTLNVPRSGGTRPAWRAHVASAIVPCPQAVEGPDR
jgi:hypothetical protein